MCLKPNSCSSRLSFGLTFPLCRRGDARRPTPRQLAALEHFQSFPTTLPAAIEPHALNYCDRIDEIVCLHEEGIAIDRANIAKHYRLTDLVIPPLSDTSANFFFLTADCDWEPEHGMQIVLDGPEILYCDDHTTLAFGAAWTRILFTPNTERSAALRAEIAKL